MQCESVDRVQHMGPGPELQEKGGKLSRQLGPTGFRWFFNHNKQVKSAAKQQKEQTNQELHQYQNRVRLNRSICFDSRG